MAEHGVCSCRHVLLQLLQPNQLWGMQMPACLTTACSMASHGKCSCRDGMLQHTVLQFAPSQPAAAQQGIVMPLCSRPWEIQSADVSAYSVWPRRFEDHSTTISCCLCICLQVCPEAGLFGGWWSTLFAAQDEGRLADHHSKQAAIG